MSKVGASRGYYGVLWRENGVDTMKNYIKHYKWFWKESFSFMKGYNRIYIAWGCLRKAHKFAVDMVKWEKLTPEQRENWYLSGEGRTFEF